MDGRGLPTRAQLALSSGREISSNGRMYVNGAACDIEIKLAVADTYQRIARERRLVRPNHSEIAILHSVDPKFVKKVEEELWCHGRVLSPQEIRGNADRPIGPGSISLSQYDFFIIMRLYWENPSRGLKSYTDYLWLMTYSCLYQYNKKSATRGVSIQGFPAKAQPHTKGQVQT